MQHFYGEMAVAQNLKTEVICKIYLLHPIRLIQKSVINNNNYKK